MTFQIRSLAMREQKHETRAKKAKLAVSYITCGTLMVVWALIWLLYLTVPSDVRGSVYIATGIILSGIAVVLIGMRLGDIGKEANRDEAAMGETEVVIPQTQPSRSTVKTDPSVTVPPQPAEEIELETRQTRSW
jgi:hypothetical protein